MGMFSRDTITDYVRCGDFSGAKQALAHGDDIKERRSFGKTSIMNCIGNPKMVQWLLAHGADANAVDSKGMSVLFHAIFNKHVSSAMLILQHGVDDLETILYCGRTVLHEAVQRGLFVVVQELLARGADPCTRKYNYNGNISAIDMINDKQGETAVVIRQALTEYTSFAAALAARNDKAVSWILKRSYTDWDALFPDSADVCADPPLHRWIYSTIALHKFDEFLWALEIAASGTNANDFATNFRFSTTQSSLLHSAARHHFAAAVRYLLVECKMDARLVDAKGQRPVDLVDATGRVLSGSPPGQVMGRGPVTWK